jgi:hypothetical protein
MPLKKILLAVLICLNGIMHAQDGTIRVQRNPGRWDSTLHCGGVLQQAHFMLELSVFKPVNEIYSVFYENTPAENFLIQNGVGAHVYLGLPRVAGHYGSSGFIKPYLFTGFDVFNGLSNVDSSIDLRSFTRIPFQLNIIATLISRPRVVLLAEAGAGGALLTHRFRGPSSETTLNRFVPGFTAGFNLFFRAARRHIQGFSFKASYLDAQWFREVSFIFPIYYGRFKRNISYMD